MENISWSCIESDCLNHTPYTREVEMASYFEVEAMVQGYYQYKEIWEGEVGEQLECQRETGNPRYFCHFSRETWSHSSPCSRENLLYLFIVSALS